MLTRRRGLQAAGGVLITAALLLFGQAGYIHAKAWLAQALLERAWAQRLDGAALATAQPWPWADTAPVARLRVPRLGIDRIVLAGASGRTLAFGPAHLDGTAAPGGAGHSIVTGHRDTHFAFLRNLLAGDVIDVQTPDGVWRAYRVTGSEILDASAARYDPSPRHDALTLVTCYPFDAIAPGGPLRYAVSGEVIARSAVRPAVSPVRNGPPARHAANGGTGRPG